MTRVCWVLGLFIVLAPAGQAEETSFWDNYKDPEDGNFDILGPRKTQSGLLPVIIPFNEPAVGIGAVGGHGDRYRARSGGHCRIPHHRQRLVIFNECLICKAW